MSVNQLAMVANHPNNQISYTTTSALAGVGVPVSPTPSDNNALHATSVVEIPLGPEFAATISALFNSGGSPGHGACWLLRYGSERRPLDEVAAELGLRSGMMVTLFSEDEHAGQVEEFEVSALLEEHDDPVVRWRALPEWNTRRQLRG
jgi:hypothetical protein